LKEIGPILNAVTPVMTVFRKGNETRADLTCLKLIESTANQTSDVSDSSSQGISPDINAMAVASVALISSIFVAVF